MPLTIRGRFKTVVLHNRTDVSAEDDCYFFFFFNRPSSLRALWAFLYSSLMCLVQVFGPATLSFGDSPALAR